MKKVHTLLAFMCALCIHAASFAIQFEEMNIPLQEAEEEWRIKNEGHEKNGHFKLYTHKNDAECFMLIRTSGLWIDRDGFLYAVEYAAKGLLKEMDCIIKKSHARIRYLDEKKAIFEVIGYKAEDRTSFGWARIFNEGEKWFTIIYLSALPQDYELASKKWLPLIENIRLQK